MVNLATAKKLLRVSVLTRSSHFLWGAPGIGKSDIVRQLVKELSSSTKEKWGLVDFRAILRDPVDLRGVPYPNAQTRVTEWFAPSDLPNEKRDGKRGILFLDELNTSHMQMQNACLGLALDYKLGDYVLPDGWSVIAAGNRQVDRAGAQRLSRALGNRFEHTDVEADANVWLEDYAYENCEPEVAGFIRWRPQLIHEENWIESMEEKERAEYSREQDDRRFPSPRQWAQVSKKYRHWDDSIRQIGVMGNVGEGPAAEFEGFVRTFRELPDLDDIFDKPKSTRLPQEISAMWGAAEALARYSNRDNFGAALTYANRMGPEYEVIVGLGATKRDPSLVKTKAYINFQKENADVTVGSF